MGKIDQLIEISKDKYDYILIDSPPILVSSDTMLISKKMDALIYVVALNKSSISHTKRNINNLRFSNINILGCCATYVKEKIKKYEYEYYKNE